MPYVDEPTKIRLDITQNPYTAGELNYLVTKLVLKFLKANDLNYERINQAVGALECAKQELYRRLAAPYENKKAKENGDVY
jgi:hypothetical protein